MLAKPQFLCFIAIPEPITFHMTSWTWSPSGLEWGIRQCYFYLLLDLVLHVYCRSGRMSDEISKQIRLAQAVLQTKYSYLVDTLSPQDILPKLFSRRLITQAQMDLALGCHVRLPMNTAILSFLLKRNHSDTLHQLCDVLSATPGQEYIAEELLKSKCVWLISILLLIEEHFIHCVVRSSG